LHDKKFKKNIQTGGTPMDEKCSALTGVLTLLPPMLIGCDSISF